MKINSGRLREIIDVHRATDVRNDYGEVVNTYVKHASIRAHTKVDTGSRKVSYDVVLEYLLSVLCRNHVKIDDTDVLVIRGKDHRIISIDEDVLNGSYLIKCTTINE